MSNLHFLVLDGCDVNGNLQSIWEELQWLEWRHMPLTLLPTLNLSNLVSLDFSESTKLANLWANSDPTLEACPKLLRLDLSKCTSLKLLPDSIGRLSKLQYFMLADCKNLQNLPSSIGQLRALQQLYLYGCGRLEALPDTFTALSGLEDLHLAQCSSILNLPPIIGQMTGLTALNIDPVTEGQALGIGQLNALVVLAVSECSDEAITVLDSSDALRNMDQLLIVSIYECNFITKLPETIGLLKNLSFLQLDGCEKLQEIPNPIGQLKVLQNLYLAKCSSLQTLPDSLDTFTGLQTLWIIQCTSLTKLPTSIGHLLSLRELRIDGCGVLQSLPDSIRQLDMLRILHIMDCGSLEGLGTLRMLQWLRIWGCTSVTELPGSCLVVLDSNFWNPAWFNGLGNLAYGRPLTEI